MNPVDINAPVAQAQSNRQAITDLFGSQRNEATDFLTRYKGALAGQPTTAGLAGRIGDELNLGAKRQAANTITNTVNNLPYTYGAATRGYDVNSNQLSRIVGQKTSELTPAMNTANSAVASAEKSLDTRLGYELADRDRELLPYQTEQQMLSERNARETTGYSQAFQGELDAIIQKMQAGITLSEGEKNRAQALALAEKQYKQALDVAKANQSSSRDPYVTLGEGQTLFNTSTGQPVYQTGKTYAPSSGGGDAWS